MTKPQENQKPDAQVDPEVEAETASDDAKSDTVMVTLKSKDGKNKVKVRKPSADYSNLRFGYGYTEV